METNQNKIKRVTFINEFRQNGKGYPDTITEIGSILVAGCKNYIMLWKIIGEPKQLRRLKEGMNFVLCIVISKKTLWFSTGNKDGIIKCWNAEWQNKGYQANYKFEDVNPLFNRNQYKPKQQHEVTKLLLNKNEDELISCYHDGTIKLWKVNCHMNSIQYEYIS